MNITNATEKALKLIERSKVATIGILGEGGYPNTKAMLKIKTEGLATFWFSTNTSSKKVKQILNDKRGCVYFCDANAFEGLMFTGEFEVFQDIDTKKRFWVEGFERYYSKGVEDPDYTVLKFITKQVNLYDSLKNLTFDIKGEL